MGTSVVDLLVEHQVYHGCVSSNSRPLHPTPHVSTGAGIRWQAGCLLALVVTPFCQGIRSVHLLLAEPRPLGRVFFARAVLDMLFFNQKHGS